MIWITLYSKQPAVRTRAWGFQDRRAAVAFLGAWASRARRIAVGPSPAADAQSVKDEENLVQARAMGAETVY